MYWGTLAALGVYLSLQMILGILYLILGNQPGTRKD